MKKKIILGSGSPRRRELLEQIHVTFDVIVGGGEEIYTSTQPEEIVKELALVKAENVAKILDEKRQAVVIGADTVVVLDQEILGKPKDEDDAFQMLKHLQGGAGRCPPRRRMLGTRHGRGRRSANRSGRSPGPSPW